MPNQPRPDNRPHMIRFTDTEWNAILAKAETRGTTAAELIRSAVARDLKRSQR